MISLIVNGLHVGQEHHWRCCWRWPSSSGKIQCLVDLINFDRIIKVTKPITIAWRIEDEIEKGWDWKENTKIVFSHEFSLALVCEKNRISISFATRLRIFLVNYVESSLQVERLEEFYKSFRRLDAPKLYAVVTATRTIKAFVRLIANVIHTRVQARSLQANSRKASDLSFFSDTRDETSTCYDFPGDFQH